MSCALRPRRDQAECHGRSEHNPYPPCHNLGYGPNPNITQKVLPQGTEVEAGTLLDVAGAVPASVTARLLDACRSDVFARVQAAVVDTIADGWGVRIAIGARATCASGLAGVATASADGLL